MDNDSMKFLSDAWRAALVEDGFTITPTYSSEAPERAWTARSPDGWVVMVVARPAGEPAYRGGLPTKRAEWSIHAWAPDSLAVDVPTAADVAALRANAGRCGYCKRVGPTTRLGFAGRACLECRQKHAARIEHPGWCD